MYRARQSHLVKGFSLVELTIVLIIVSLLASGLLFGIAAQRNAAETSDARRQLENIHEALVGYAMANGRLPCPAPASIPNSDANAGKAIDVDENNKFCTTDHGVLPWVTLGIPETDPWGNRFSYSASRAYTQFKSPEAQASFSLASVGNINVKESAGSTTSIASELPAVVVSHGSMSAGAYQSSGAKLPGASGDEAENADADLSFVAHAPGGSFDDLLIWIAPSILKAKMVAAGRLP